MRRGGRISPMSAKRRGQLAERKAAIEVVRARCADRCEARSMIATVAPLQAVKCDLFGMEGHEPLKRSRSSTAWLDPAQIVWTCRPCHDWTEAEPKLATECGLLVPSWADPVKGL